MAEYRLELPSGRVVISTSLNGIAKWIQREYPLRTLEPEPLDPDPPLHQDRPDWRDR